MSAQIRVMLVDDAPSIRHLLRDLISNDPSFTVCAEAGDGQQAVDHLNTDVPDIIVLDVEMPVMSGIEALKLIRPRHPTLPIVMFSAVTGQGAEATLQALSLGASDFVLKPTGVGGLTKALEAVRSELIPRLKALATAKQKSAIKSPPPIARIARRRAAVPIRILAIGSSTGGPNALASLIPKLPENINVPIVIVQHMPPEFTRHLAQRLDGLSALTVSEAEDGQALQAGHVLIAPGDFHMTIKGGGTSPTVSLNQGPQIQSVRPAVDLLFKSVAEYYGAASVGVILTGMGQDGLDGCHALSDVQAHVLVQDENTSVVWGMPGQVARAGIADQILPLKNMADAIVNLLPKDPRSAHSVPQGKVG